MPPFPQIHKCPNGRYRIGNGECHFETHAKAVSAFEHWIKTKKHSELDFDPWYTGLTMAERRAVQLEVR